MSIDSLKRVIWRLDSKFTRGSKIGLKALRRAIMFECGTDERTLKENIKRLKELGWIKQLCRYTFVVLDDE